MKPIWPATGLNSPDMRPDFDWSQHPNTRALQDELNTLRTALLLASREAAQARAERDALAEKVKALEADLVAAAGECIVPMPEPGTDMARVMVANAIMRRERDEARAALVALEAFARSFAETAEAAVRHAEAPRGGQHVPFHGDFNSVPPSTIGRLRWWAREARAALTGTQ